MRLAAALTLSAALLLGAAQPVAAAPSVDLRPPGTVVVGPGKGTYATFSAADVPASIRAMDLYIYGPGGEYALVDLQLRNRPGIWEGEYKFHRSEGFGRWKAVLTMRDNAGRPSKGGTVHFTVKRRTTLTTADSQSRGSGVSGVLRKMTANGRYTGYAKQKVRLYRWNGSWTYVSADVTDGKGRYSFKGRSGKLQIRYAGNGLDAGAVRTVN